MAYTASTVLLALMVVTTTSSVVHCLVIDGQNVGQISLVGRVTCNVTTGNPVGTGVPGITVSLSCNGGTTSLAQGLSSLTGLVTILLSTADSAIFDRSLCVATATFPVGTGSVALPTAILSSALTLLGITSTSTAAGKLANFTFGTLEG